MKEITKLENTSLSDFRLHTEECIKRAFFSRIVCAAVGGMFGSLKVNFQILIGIRAKARKGV